MHKKHIIIPGKSIGTELVLFETFDLLSEISAEIMHLNGGKMQCEYRSSR